MASDNRNNNSEKTWSALNSTSEAQRQNDSSKKGKKKINIVLNL